MTPVWVRRDRQLIPASEGWGRGFGGNAFSDDDLTETAGYIHEARAAGYAPVGYGERFFAWTPGFERVTDHFIVPAGFDARNHPEREGVDPDLLEPDTPTSLLYLWQVPASLQDYYTSCGWALDQHGRPCNPHGIQLITDPRIGLNTSLGSSYEAGETVVVDVVVDDGTHVLLTTRQDMSEPIPSLVGGYSRPVDYGVSLADWRRGHRAITHAGVFAAARRVVELKTGVVLPEEAGYEIVWGIRPASSRHTWNFWTVTLTVRVRVESGANRLLASEAGSWHDKRTIGDVARRLWPDHRRGLEAALR